MLERGFPAKLGEVGNSEASMEEGSETCNLKIVKSKMQANKLITCSKDEKENNQTSCNNAELKINKTDISYSNTCLVHAKGCKETHSFNQQQAYPSI